MDLPLLREAKNLENKRVLLRLDLNVPVEDGVVRDNFRIRKILPTIEFLQKKKAKIFVVSHHSDEKQSLRPIAHYLSAFVKTSFTPDFLGEGVSVLEKALGTDTVVVGENLRFYEGEKRNDLSFAKKLASLGDVYVNDAFSASHRHHASIVSLPKLLPPYVGLLFEEEASHLQAAFAPPKPFLFILGGMKSATKLPLALKFLENADSVFIGGVLANNLFKAKGFEVGTSLVEDAHCDVTTLLKSGKVMLPVDVVVQNSQGIFTKLPSEVSPDDNILDVGPQTVFALKKLVQKSKFILWNGPLGDYFQEEFEKATVELIKIIGESKAQSVVGGGDTAALISRLGAEDQFDFVSTAGGAMLDFLAHKTLPGIEALKNQT